MGSHGIKDKVAIVGMACTKFGEHWDLGVDELVLQAAEGAFDSAGVTRDDVDAYWLGTAQSGMSGLLVSRPLRVKDKPVTRVENFCRVGFGGLAPGGVRGLERGLRRRHGDRGREAEGLGLSRVPTPSRSRATERTAP